ncbi:hypothetical protein SAY86_015483 [Trapa natans]|uniref:FAS1 domain-containing protein n=1 Tax=Trapa natans TaxID=22666 RepID=A0AAN7QYJ6_TRANT|nr:hypothetical protein SAY86_015483 [Trapa natans]
MNPFRSLAMEAAAAAVLLVLLLSPPRAEAHNITRILAGHPSLSTFNHYLTLTHLATEINRRLTITVLAVDNAAMSNLLAKHYSLGTIKNILSLHVLVDYFGTKKVHQLTDRTTSTSTLFQASGSAPGTAGYVNITDLKGGKVAFGSAETGELNAVFVKSVEEHPYNISVLEISQVLSSPEAEAPTAAPSQLNLTAILRKQGCKAFADLITSSGADSTFQENIDGGLTVFCTPDSVVTAFMPKYKNLTAAQKTSFILFHGVPVYQSLQGLKSSNGLMNTLATDGASKYDFTVQNNGDVVTLKTDAGKSTITGTVIDESPLIVFKIDKFLLPKELFKASDAPAPKKKSSKDAAADSPDASSPDGQPSDQTAADSNFARKSVAGVRQLAGAVMCLCLSVAFM